MGYYMNLGVRNEGSHSSRQIWIASIIRFPSMYFQTLRYRELVFFGKPEQPVCSWWTREVQFSPGRAQHG